MAHQRVPVLGVILVLIALTGGGGVWLVLDRPDESQSSAGDELAEVFSEPEPEPDAEPEPASDVAEVAYREASDETATPEVEEWEPEVFPTGNLELTLLWDDDDSFATDIHVFARGFDPDGNRVTRSGRSDDAGKVLLKDLPAGDIDMILENGDEHVAKVISGGTTGATLRLPPGGELRGRVITDDGFPVAGACVWVSSGPQGTRGREVTESDENGRFRIQGARWDRWVGARKAGLGPSDLHRVNEYTAASVFELMVERDASCVMFRLDQHSMDHDELVRYMRRARNERRRRASSRTLPLGAPQEPPAPWVGATMLVSVLRSPRWERRVAATGDRLPPPPFRLRPKSGGRFHFEHATRNSRLKVVIAQAGGPPEAHYVRASAGPGGRVTMMDVCDRPHYCNARHNFVLPRTHEIRGTISDAKGDPISEARIGVVHRARFGAPGEQLTARTTGDGSYVLKVAYTEEPILLFASSHGPAGFVIESVTLGEQSSRRDRASRSSRRRYPRSTRWSPVLEEREPLTVRVVSPSGHALVGWRVRFGRGNDLYKTTTSLQGVVHSHQPVEWPLRISVFPPGEAWTYRPIVTQDVNASFGDYEIVVPL